MIDEKYLAKKHNGMRVSAGGTLRQVKDCGDGIKFSCGELLRNLEEMSARFYDGDIGAVDEFLQLFCLDENRPKEERKNNE